MAKMKMCKYLVCCILQFMKHKKYLLVATVVLAIFAAVFAALYFTKKQEPSVVGRTERKTILTNTMPYDGGACSFYVTDSAGKAQDECVRYENVDTALRMLSAADATRASSYKSKVLLKIDADMHIEVEKRTPSTPKPQYSNKDVYHLDKIYSVELVSY